MSQLKITYTKKYWIAQVITGDSYKRKTYSNKSSWDVRLYHTLTHTQRVRQIREKEF